MSGGAEHRLLDPVWQARELAWRAECECGWQSERLDLQEGALAAFRQHRMDVLGWTVVRPHPPKA